MISNIAEREVIEDTFEIPFKYPNIYKAQPIIDGKEETTLPIILDKTPHLINYGIWGLLPNSFEDSWESFQSTTLPLLNLSSKSISNHPMGFDAFQHRRCTVVITGYIVSQILNGKLYPYLVSNSSPFQVAAVYNITADGFYTFALITKPALTLFQNIKNINAFIPITLCGNQVNSWLSKGLIRESGNNSNCFNPQTHPLHKEFYKMSVSDINKLNPTFYAHIPPKLL